MPSSQQPPQSSALKDDAHDGTQQWARRRSCCLSNLQREREAGGWCRVCEMSGRHRLSTGGLMLSCRSQLTKIIGSRKPTRGPVRSHCYLALAFVKELPVLESSMQKKRTPSRFPLSGVGRTPAQQRASAWGLSEHQAQPGTPSAPGLKLRFLQCLSAQRIRRSWSRGDPASL